MRLPAWATAYLVVQLAIPTWQLTRPRPARFGWQMYAGLSQPTAFSAVRADGTVHDVPLNQFLAVPPRSDIDLIRYLPPAICSRTGAAAVRFQVRPERTPREVPCRR